MTGAARSVFAFGLYLIALGLTLVVAPNVLLPLFGFPQANDVWIRVAGMLTAMLGYYYVQCARAEIRRFFELSVGVRCAVFVFFAAFVALGCVGPMLLLIGSVDVAGALWTALALRSDARSPKTR